MLVAAEILFGFDKERGVPAIAKGRLQNQIVTDPGLFGDPAQLFVGFDLCQRVRHGRDARLVADTHSFDLVIQRLTQLGLGEPDVAG